MIKTRCQRLYILIYHKDTQKLTTFNGYFSWDYSHYVLWKKRFEVFNIFVNILYIREGDGDEE